MPTIAIPDTKPPIVCPDWCTINDEQHLEDLPQLEGYVIHWSGSAIRDRLELMT